jgi:hypothetical protein
MELTPFGNRKNTDGPYKQVQSMFDLSTSDVEEESEPSGFDEPSETEGDFDAVDDGSMQEDASKIKQVEESLSSILGEPSLDNLMVILTAIGMGKISMSLSEDNSSLSVSGIIELTGDNKIKKDD